MNVDRLKNLFKRYGRNVTLDQTIQDCRELRDALVEANATIESLKTRVQTLEDGA